MTLSGENKKEIIKNMSGDDMNSGAPESQIGIFTKRIEYMTIKTEDDEYDKQIKETENKDYEASFPNAD